MCCGRAWLSRAALGCRQHLTEKVHYFAAIKAPQMLLQHPAPSSHELHKPHDRQSYLSTQFILLDKAFLLPQLQMPCLWGGLAPASKRNLWHPVHIGITAAYLCHMNS